MNAITHAAQAKISVADICEFISRYKWFESLSLREASAVLKAICSNSENQHKYQHLCDQWRWKKRRFGEFYLNLDYQLHIAFLKYWGFTIKGLEEYLQKVQQNEAVALFVDPPLMVDTINKVVLFFGNHSICPHVTDDLKLDILPRPAKQYGNATNWGEYILNLPVRERVRVLELVRDHYFLPKNQ